MEALRVVIVDDAADIVFIERTQLEAEGCKIMGTFTDAAQAIANAPWAEVDACIVDLMMPRVSGWELLGFLVNNHPHIRRVVVTAANSAVVDELHNAAIADSVVCKPYRMSELVAALDQPNG